MRTLLCLLLSNCFMTYAWYGHLKQDTSKMPMIRLILICWGIAFFEYLFMVPANNHFSKLEGYSPFQLKILQEVITLVVFFFFAIFYLKEHFQWNYLIAFILILGAVYFMFMPNAKG